MTTTDLHEGDIVHVGKGRCEWTILSLTGDTAVLRTGVGRLGRHGRTTTAPVATLARAFA